MKPSFLHWEKPPIVAMIHEETAVEAICTVQNAEWDGAEAYGIHLEHLKPEERTEEKLRAIFAACGNRPVYITSYRKPDGGMSEDECAELLLRGLRCGATLCDVMGDFWHPEPLQLTDDAEAVKKQRALIDEIHAAGGEVLISSHLFRFLPEEEILRMAKEQERRGADIVKIVSSADDEDELMADLLIIHRLKKELGCKFLFLAGGKECRRLREIGPLLGSCMYLCVERYFPSSARAQLQVRAARIVRDHTALF